MKKSIYILFVSIIAMLFGLNVFMMYKAQDVFLSVDFYRSKYEISTPKNEVLIFLVKE